MLDRKDPPTSVEDSKVDVNPYEITDLIWDLISPYFVSKYKVDYRESYPSKEVTRATIVSLINKRTPGREGSKIHGKGENFLKFLQTTTDGFVQEVYVQQQEIFLEYIVFSTSTAEVKRIAWDLEQAILETVGVLQAKIEGFQLHFEQQMQDSSMLLRQQDEMIKRSIKFRALLPIKYVRLVPELRFIEVLDSWGSISISSSGLSRDSSEKNYYIPVQTGQRVNAIKNVFLKSDTYPFEWEPLILNTDYYVKRDSDHIRYIQWNDTYGRVPLVGQEFKVFYEITQIMKSSSIKKPQ